MTTVLLDSHVVHWWSAEPERLSAPAARAIEHGWPLVTKDARLRGHGQRRRLTVW